MPEPHVLDPEADDPGPGGALDQPTREKLGDMVSALRKLAHDINNPLTALLGRAQLLKGLVGDDPRLMKQAETIEESGQRIAELVQQVSRELRNGTRLLEHDDLEA